MRFTIGLALLALGSLVFSGCGSPSAPKGSTDVPVPPVKAAEATADGPNVDLKPVLAAGLIDAQGQSVSADAYQGKLIGLYFSAHWCPPCKVFTPKLVALRDAHADRFEVLFVSADNSAEEMAGYMQEAQMKWPAVKFDAPARMKIAADLGIESIPTLIVLKPDGQIITREGYNEVDRQGAGALTAWQSAAGK
ncbi:MAG: hypothetical protein AMXMBFR7_42470 [Planctomycetota bacterium]